MSSLLALDHHYRQNFWIKELSLARCVYLKDAQFTNLVWTRNTLHHPACSRPHERARQVKIIRRVLGVSQEDPTTNPTAPMTLGDSSPSAYLQKVPMSPRSI